MFELTIDRPTRNRKADDYAENFALAAELEIIIDETARIQANKNHGSDINPNA